MPLLTEPGHFENAPYKDAAPLALRLKAKMETGRMPVLRCEVAVRTFLVPPKP
jgi:hypothetical protein